MNVMFDGSVSIRREAFVVLFVFLSNNGFQTRNLGIPWIPGFLT